MKNLSTSPPPLSSHAVTLSYDRRKTTWLVISPVYPSISLSTRRPKETRSKRRRTRLWARVYDCLHEHVCAQMYELERVSVPALVFENVYASLPLTFCRLGGQENLTRHEQNRLLQCNIQLDIAWTGFYLINNHLHNIVRRWSYQRNSTHPDKSVVVQDI